MLYITFMFQYWSCLDKKILRRSIRISTFSRIQSSSSSSIGMISHVRSWKTIGRKTRESCVFRGERKQNPPIEDEAEKCRRWFIASTYHFLWSTDAIRLTFPSFPLPQPSSARSRKRDRSFAQKNLDHLPRLLLRTIDVVVRTEFPSFFRCTRSSTSGGEAPFLKLGKSIEGGPRSSSVLTIRIQ